MELCGYYTPPKSKVVPHDFVGQNVLRICEDIEPSEKPQCLFVKNEPIYPGQMSGLRYLANATALVSPQGTKCVMQNVFLVDGDMLEKACALASDSTHALELLWSTIYGGVRYFVQAHLISTQNLLGPPILGEIVKRHPGLNAWKDLVIDHYVEAELSEHELKLEVDSYIVSLLAMRMTLKSIEEKGYFDYSVVKRILQTTRQSFDPSWLDFGH